ncbi:vinorine synthase-like [Cucurbita pepo subsp. pepo]|uniref:vinorine synthase-like n=1 Tax=Cucurbita pepo subsp. pepo TaxID=3664 RepID=UPI000C9D7109|nr:vinorine synthase-like [Cucurbita pepo subsp. pepo]XP_023531980.1 vinorine synthase-like [Cucurbita pepo subsp. pepo]
MAVDIEVVSKETVKPSSPTPDNHRRYGLSFLDQVTVDVYNPMIYFYSAGSATAAEISDHLKKSLSTVLSHYYPLAGRVNYDELFIDCNDAGVPFIETRVNCRLSDVMNTAFPTELNKLLPFELDALDDVSMGVQLNVFECGGVAVGICISHKISDALSFFIVVNGWAAVSRGEKEALETHLSASELFPPSKTPIYNTRTSIFRQRVAKRYQIDSASIETIRAQYAEYFAMENQRRPSRVEALSAFLYGRFIAAIKGASNSNPANGSSESEKKIFLVCHAVNIRSRLDPPVPDYAFGNYYRATFAVPSETILNDDYCYDLVKLAREEIAKIDKSYLERLQESSKFLEAMKKAAAQFSTGELISCSFTSLCRMPIYDADFGWGKPAWISSPALMFKNLFVLIDKKDGDGVDVYVHLKPENMEILEADEKFLKYAKLPSN